MPNLPMHIYLADQVAQQLDWGSVYDNVGSFFLGSTAPDIRAMTKWPRERTHFAPLSVEDVGTGVRTMFQHHPHLADFGSLSKETRAFMLGYISHLVADELWITTVFRTHFEDKNMVTDNEVEAHIWDRALQLDMDRQSVPKMNGFQEAAEMMSCADEGVTVEFLDPEVLREWGTWVQRFMGWEFSWERLKRSLNRMYRDDDDVQTAVDHFLAEMPRSLDRVYEKVPEEKIEAYRERAVEITLAQVREFIPS